MPNKKIAALTLTMMIGLVFILNPSAVYARWNYLYDVNHSLSISSSGIASVYAFTEGYSTVSGVEVDAQLQQYKNNVWTTISPSSWTASATGIQVTLTKTYAVAHGYQYRLVTMHRATCNGDIEGVTVVGNAISY